MHIHHLLGGLLWHLCTRNAPRRFDDLFWHLRNTLNLLRGPLLYSFTRSEPRHLHSRLLHSQKALGCPLPFEAWAPRPCSQVTSPTPLRTAAQRLLLVHRPSRKTSSCSACSSSENATTTPVSSEVDERHSIGGPAAPLLMQRREASAIPVRLCHSTREKFHVTLISHSERKETCCNTLTQTENRAGTRDTNCTTRRV